MSLPCVRDLQVCEACLQASPRGVRISPPLCKGRGTTKWWKGCKNNPSVGLRRQLPLHKGAVIIPDNQSFFRLVIKAKNRDEKSPLFFNYKICTIQLLKFLLPTFLFKEKYGRRKVGYLQRRIMASAKILAFCFRRSTEINSPAE